MKLQVSYLYDLTQFTEIRELDSERQSLVYNHHHELIAASDTIAAVSIYSAQGLFLLYLLSLR